MTYTCCREHHHQEPPAGEEYLALMREKNGETFADDFQGHVIHVSHLPDVFR